MNFYKLNFDGSFNNGVANLGTIIRNHNGEIVNIHRESTQDDSAIQVEARALLAGIRKALEIGIRNIILEGDNLTVVNTLKRNWKPTLGQTIVNDIRILFRQFNKAEIYHCYREGNQAADCIAKHNCNFNSQQYDPLLRDFYVIIRKDELGWSFVRKTT